jgi:hypothetical protein
MNAIDELQLQSGYWYLATPYSKWAAGIDDACEVAAQLAGQLVLAGVAVFSPIAHSHTVSRAAKIDPFSHHIWLPADKPLFEAAHGLIVAALPGWSDSFGVGEEIKWAIAHGKPRVLLDPTGLAWAALD